ncbi:uncharacterized protein HaLaN_31013, partial [Haematococcus lacustris]
SSWSPCPPPPAALYRAAMMRLHASPAVLEVLGPPLRGSPLTASIITGGGVYRTPGSGFWPQAGASRPEGAAAAWTSQFDLLLWTWLCAGQGQGQGGCQL